VCVFAPFSSESVAKQPSPSQTITLSPNVFEFANKLKKIRLIVRYTGLYMHENDVETYDPCRGVRCNGKREGVTKKNQQFVLRKKQQNADVLESEYK
jgi:hypothetical protein